MSYKFGGLGLNFSPSAQIAAGRFQRIRTIYCLRKGSISGLLRALKEFGASVETIAKLMDSRADLKIEELILRELYRHPGHEAILLPSLFNPPIMLSNIFRIACGLKKKGYTTAPDRRMGGWHMRLQPPGIAFCEGAWQQATPQVAQNQNRPLPL